MNSRDVRTLESATAYLRRAYTGVGHRYQVTEAEPTPDGRGNSFVITEYSRPPLRVTVEILEGVKHAD